MVSEKAAKIWVLTINYFFGIVCLLCLLIVISNIKDNSQWTKVISFLLVCLTAFAGCYGAHKSNTCMLITNGILYIIFSFLGLIQGIDLLVNLPQDMKALSLIVFAFVAIEMAGGYFAICLSKCIKRNKEEQLPTIELSTGA